MPVLRISPPSSRKDNSHSNQKGWDFRSLKDKGGLFHGAALLKLARGLPRRTEYIDIIGEKIDGFPYVKVHELEVRIEPTLYVLPIDGVCVIKGKDLPEIIADKIEAILKSDSLKKRAKHYFDLGYLMSYDRHRTIMGINVAREILVKTFGKQFKERIYEAEDRVPSEIEIMKAVPEGKMHMIKTITDPRGHFYRNIFSLLRMLSHKK